MKVLMIICMPSLRFGRNINAASYHDHPLLRSHVRIDHITLSLLRLSLSPMNSTTFELQEHVNGEAS